MALSNPMDFKLRPWRPDDLDSLVKYANNAKIAAKMTDAFAHPYLRENGKAFIEYAMHDEAAYILAIEVKGEAAGGIGLHPRTGIERKNAELGYWLAEPYWGQGIITRAITEIVLDGFEKMDINRIFARPFGNNKGSQRALEKAGFKLEARFEKSLIKNGEFLDELIYAIRKKEIS